MTVSCVYAGCLKNNRGGTGKMKKTICLLMAVLLAFGAFAAAET